MLRYENALVPALLVGAPEVAGALMEAVLAFMPEEDRVKYAAMTGQSLFYMGETNLRHKILAIVEEEGAARASYALKILQSEGELTISAQSQDVGETILMLGDGNGDFTKAIGLEMDGSKFGMGTRSQRYSMIVKDGVVKELNVEQGGEFKVSAADYMLAQL